MLHTRQFSIIACDERRTTDTCTHHYLFCLHRIGEFVLHNHTKTTTPKHPPLSELVSLVLELLLHLEQLLGRRSQRHTVQTRSEKDPNVFRAESLACSTRHVESREQLQQSLRDMLLMDEEFVRPDEGCTAPRAREELHNEGVTTSSRDR